MSKYYYTCPIKAAYMAKEFGVQFKQWLYPLFESTERELMPQSFKQICEEVQYHFNRDRKFDYDNRWIVALENENIFDPLQGDIGIERNLHSADCCYFGGKYWAYENEERRSTPHQQRVKIILREGKQFFMPEVEND